MGLVTTEHRLRCTAHDSCWVKLIRKDRWSVLSIELSDGRIVPVRDVERFEDEVLALDAAKSWLCESEGRNYT
ncbi:MAG: hypothetical protein V4679_03335 [Pseudomonadota bacterium]